MKEKRTQEGMKKKIKNTEEWNKKVLEKGGYKFSVLLSPEDAEIARNIPNKRQFLIQCIHEKYGVA